jgi:hypothetical protein
MRQQGRGLGLAGAMLLVAACAGEIDYTNEGEVCLVTRPSGALEVRVIFPDCLSSSCDLGRSASCSVTRSGNDLIIESRGNVAFQRDGTCALDCGKLRAICQSEPLEPGEYRVVHGDASATATLPREQYLRLFTIEALFDDQTWCEIAGR